MRDKQKSYVNFKRLDLQAATATLIVVLSSATSGVAQSTSSLPANSIVPIPSNYSTGQIGTFGPSPSGNVIQASALIAAQQNLTSYPIVRAVDGTIDWSSAISNARSALSEKSLPQPSVAKAKLEQSIVAMENLFTTAGEKRKSGWLDFLMIEALRKEMAKDQPSVNDLIQIEKNTRQNHPGLELKVVSDFRKNLVTYIDALRFGSDPTLTIRAIDSRLEALSKTLAEKRSEMSRLEIDRDLGLIANYLASAGQAPQLLNSIRNTYSKPTARVLVSQAFLQKHFQTPVNQPTAVNENILGTQLRGQSCFLGQVAPILVSNYKAATVQLQLRGQFSANNTGVNRGVTVQTSSRASILASESVQLGNNGLVDLNDTNVSSSFESQINSIDHNLRIVRRIATRKAAEQKPQADAIGRSRLESRLSGQFHEQVVSRLSQSNQRLQPPALLALARLGLTRPVRQSWSSPNYLALLWDTRGADQLAADSSCPLVVENFGVTIQIHQSMLNNAFDPVLAGRVIRSKDLDGFSKQLGELSDEELTKEAKGEPWAITLAGYHPVEVEFDKGLVSFQIRTVRLDRGDQSLDQPATIRANYRMVLVDGKLQFRREGDVDIQFAGRAQRGLRSVTLRSFMKSKFDQALKEDLLREPIDVSKSLPSDAPRLQMVAVQSNEGWLQFTLD